MKKNKNIFQQKGFYFALYSVVIGMALLASVATFSNLHSLSKKNMQLATTKITKTNEEDEIAPVLNNQSKSYLAPEDRKINKPTPHIQNRFEDIKRKSASQLVVPSPTIMPDTNSNENPKPTTENNMPQPSQNINENGEQSFNSFDDNQKMSWPVFGQIVMDYDDQNLVYDKTLEQYRTNDSISLSANVGEQVKASADGVVKLITNTPENGNTIVIDHGNDWTTTYSQLQDDLLVNEGDVVKKGQVIGGVSSPTKYGVLLGSHLDFKVAHEDNSVDPKLIMAEK